MMADLSAEDQDDDLMEQSIRNELPGTVNETISEKGAARLTYGNHLVTISVT